MNKSGLPVGSLAKFYQVQPAEVLVVHDEMDLPAGGAKMKTGGAAGNNGVKDIVAHLGTRDFWRLRIGIGHPRDLAAKFGGDMTRDEVVDYVLHRPDKTDQKAIDECIDRCLIPMAPHCERRHGSRDDEIAHQTRTGRQACQGGNHQERIPMKCGIVGLPNVGNSTTFNALQIP